MAPNVFQFQEPVTARIVKPVIFHGKTIPSKTKVQLRGFRSDGVLLAEYTGDEVFPLEFTNCKPENAALLKEQLTSISGMTTVHEHTLLALAESLRN